jgi:glycine/D-amino acid oxidase-like deaminating enzyme/nitrite reductase/ring-hydroxylating ferredoxin subunit
VTSGASYWLESTRSPGYAPLEGDLSTQVAVVGAGIAGLTTALLLKQEGCEVVVLEAAEVGAGVTGHTTGKLTAAQGLLYSRIEEKHGAEASRTYAASQVAAVALVSSLAESLRIECDLEPIANFVFAEREDELDLLRNELDACRRAGLSPELDESLDVPFPTVAAVRVDGQSQLHARKYLLGLARAVHGDGSTVFEGTRVFGIESGAPSRLETEAGVVTAEHVVLATNAPITSEGLFFARAHPRRAYAVGALAIAPFRGMWINVGSPTRSLRTAPLEDGRRLLLVVGDGHRVGQEDSEAHYEALRSYVSEHFATAEPRYEWSTQDQFSVDDLPYIGRIGDTSSGVYVATGFGGWGLSNGSLAGMLLRDAVLGRRNAWAGLYDPGRSSLRRAPGPLLRENANVARQLVGGKLRNRPTSVAEIEPGSGEVVELDGERAAVYRNEAGDVHAVSAACTHMGCVVAWNAAERSWDCPCHGSRFDVDGTVLAGPATRPLEAVGARPMGARR